MISFHSTFNVLGAGRIQLLTRVLQDCCGPSERHGSGFWQRMAIEPAGRQVPLMRFDSAHFGQPKQSNPWPHIASHSFWSEHFTWPTTE